MTVATWLTRRAGPGRHPSDDDLTLLALAGIHAADVLVAVHVSECATCTERMARLEAALSSQRDQLAAAADRVFTPARLEHQRSAILHRIGGARLGARVLAFPRRAVAGTPRRETLRRSVAAAAVAGLLVGAVAGRLFDPGRTYLGRERQNASRITEDRTAGLEARQATAAADEAFLRDFETAVGAPQVEALRTLDELTPHPVDQVASR